MPKVYYTDGQQIKEGTFSTPKSQNLEKWLDVCRKLIPQIPKTELMYYNEVEVSERYIIWRHENHIVKVDRKYDNIGHIVRR